MMINYEIFSIERVRLAAVTLLSTAVMAGCAQSDRSPVFSAAYACEDGLRLTVVFERDAALVRLPDARTIRLAQQRAASGILYSTEGYELRGKGDDATWDAPGATVVQCKSV